MTLSLRVVSILPNHHLSSFLKKVIGSFKVCSQPGPVTCWAGLWLQIPRVTESRCGGNSIICSIFTTLWVQMDPVTRDEADLTLSSHQSIIFNKNEICFRSKHPVMMISNNNLDKSHHQPHHDHRRDLTKRRKVDLCISSKPLCIPKLSLSAWRSAQAQTRSVSSVLSLFSASADKPQRSRNRRDYLVNYRLNICISQCHNFHFTECRIRKPSHYLRWHGVSLH